MLFSDMADPDAGWRLRKVLQTEPRIIVFASATSRFDEIDNPDRALYDLFRVRTLRPLDTKQCEVLWETVSGRPPAREAVRSLEILTGGSPRLVSIVASFGAALSFRDLMAHLLDLVDDHTEYFKSHLESLPAQERRVYLALAALWKPATTREIADHARLETSPCSAQLARLEGRGVVRVAGGSPRRKQYYLTERLYNIYYLLRRRRGPDRFVEALIHFMESYYSPTELKDISVRMIRDAAGLGAEMLSLQPITLKGLMELPSLAEHREELLEMMPAGSAERAARELFEKALNVRNGAEDTVAAYEEVIRCFGESQIPAVLEWVAKALVNKGAALGALNRLHDVLETCDEVVCRFGKSDTPLLLESVAAALMNKGIAFDGLNQPQDALASYDEIVRRFGESEVPAVLEQVVKALVNKGAILGTLNRPREVLEVSDEVVRRFAESEPPTLLESVATALRNKGVALGMLNRPREALDTCGEVVRRFGESDSPELLEPVATALVNRGRALGALNRPQDALEAYDEVVRRFGENENPAVMERVATALAKKGYVLGALSRSRDALDAYDEVVRRFGDSEIAALRMSVSVALLGRADIEIESRQHEKAAETATRVIEQSGGAPKQRFQGHVIRAMAILASGGDRFASEPDVEAVLTLLPELGPIPREAVTALMDFSVALGPQRMCELIQASPSPHLLLPLTTALERELGREPRVAREVDEVARDIQRTLAELRANRTPPVEKRDE